MVNWATNLKTRTYLIPTIQLANQWDTTDMDLDNVTAVVYTLKISAHLDQDSLNASIFPVALFF